MTCLGQADQPPISRLVLTPHRYVLVTALRLSSELHRGGSNTNFLIPGHLSSDVSIPGLPIWLQWAAPFSETRLISSDALPSRGRRVNLEDCSLLTGKWIMACLETGLVRWPQVRRVPCDDPQLLRGGASLEEMMDSLLPTHSNRSHSCLTGNWQHFDKQTMCTVRDLYWPIKGLDAAIPGQSEVMTLSPSNCLLSIQFPWLVILTHCVYWWQSK